MSQIEGRNPVLEALRAGAEINKIFVQRQSGGSLRQVYDAARKAGVILVETDRKTLDAMSEGRPHQGVVAHVAAEAYIGLDELVARSLASAYPLLVVADHVEDPHNLGAILRSSLAAGAQGLIIPKRRSAALSPTVAKASAGASAHLPVSRVANIAQTVETLKQSGYWVVGAEAGGDSLFKTRLTGPLAVVVGSEGTGVSRLVREKCDLLVEIPMQGPVNSLNASVALGIVLFEIVRQRA